MASKYHNHRIMFDGVMFDSIREASRWQELKHQQSVGLISDLRRQVKFELIPAHKGVVRNERSCSYIADFVYVRDGQVVVEDSKGVRTEVYKIKRKLMRHVYGLEIREV